MPRLRTLSLSELSDEAQKWDDLWHQSGSALPSKRAEGVRLWCDSFASGKQFCAVVVEEGDHFVAAIPLFNDRIKLFKNDRLTANCMASAGDLLIDPTCNVDRVTETLARHLARLPGTLVSFEGIDIRAARWQRLIAALDAIGQQTHISDGYDVGEIDILHDWDAYTKSWSRNHRSAVKRSRKKLEREGVLEIERLRAPSDDELYETLEACFVVEDLGWKGKEGTSIRKTPSLRNYLHQDARMVRDLGLLDLWLLKLDGKIIAFEYCHFSKGICFSHKISFDPAFDRFSPGRVLRCMQLELYHQDPEAVCLNTLGVLCSAKSKWTTRSYRSSRLFVAASNPCSNLLFRAFKLTRRMARCFRKTSHFTETLQPGAAKYLESANPGKPSLVKKTVALTPDLYGQGTLSNFGAHAASDHIGFNGQLGSDAGADPESLAGG